MNWATNHDASLDKLRRVQSSLTVDLIMVPRDAFHTCTSHDTAADVHSGNTNRFSYIPVIDDSGRVLGLLDAERWFESRPPTTPIGDDYQRLCEEIVIGADASILDFVMQADTFPTNLVVSGNKIAGLASLSDLQQLPVRAALFSLITSLEMAMAAAIEARWLVPEDWLDLLSPGRQSKVWQEIEKAKSKDGFVSEIAFTQISDKADLIRKGKLLNGTSNELANEFTEIKKLRDKLAHGNRYAESPQAARHVCQVTRTIDRIKRELLIAIEGLQQRRGID